MGEEKTFLQKKVKEIYDKEYDDEDKVVKDLLFIIIDKVAEGDLKERLLKIQMGELIADTGSLEVEVGLLKEEVKEWSERHQEVSQQLNELKAKGIAEDGQFKATPLKDVGGFNVKTPLEETPTVSDSPFTGLEGMDVHNTPRAATDGDDQDLSSATQPKVAKKLMMGEDGEKKNDEPMDDDSMLYQDTEAMPPWYAAENEQEPEEAPIEPAQNEVDFADGVSNDEVVEETLPELWQGRQLRKRKGRDN
jgi:hypothetical protein